MFGEEKKGLRNLSLSSRLAVTAFLLLMGLSYIFGFLFTALIKERYSVKLLMGT